MRVRMKISLSGTRDGADWPTKGGHVELPDDEAHSLIAGGLAVEEPEEESASEPPAEENAKAPATEEKAVPVRKATASGKTAAGK